MIEQVLTNRGIKQGDVEHYLNTTSDDILDPTLLAGIDSAAKVLVKYIGNDLPAMVQVDSDCDGMTSAALLINYLHGLFPYWVENRLTYRVHTGKQHGLILDTIPTNVKLVIAPDSSSNEYDIHQTLMLGGVDVIVIDHHEAEKVSEDAFVINNQLCDYPNKSLSGVGMVYKFCQYIDSLLGIDQADQYLDLVALGEIADVMDLRPFETRELIREGLEQISNPFFKGMTIKNAYSLGGKVTPFGVAFYIAPYVNAVTRCGTVDEKMLLFESMLDFKAYDIIPSTKRGCKGQTETRVEQACRTCVNVKSRQKKNQDKSLAIIEDLIAENHLLDYKLCIVKLDKEYAVDKALTGLVANVIASKYQHPTLILNETELGWEGSGRNFQSSGLTEFRKFLDESGYFEYAEGHESAFGCGITDEKLAEFIPYAETALANIDFSPKYNVDFIYDMITINETDILNLADFDYIWGQGVSEPYILIKDVKVTQDNITLMKGSTFKITTDKNVTFIKFNSSEEEFNAIYPASTNGCTTLNIIGTFQKNIWNGFVNAQIQIVDYEVSKNIAYYF